MSIYQSNLNNLAQGICFSTCVGWLGKCEVHGADLVLLTMDTGTSEQKLFFSLPVEFFLFKGDMGFFFFDF